MIIRTSIALPEANDKLLRRLAQMRRGASVSALVNGWIVLDGLRTFGALDLDEIELTSWLITSGLIRVVEGKVTLEPKRLSR